MQEFQGKWKDWRADFKAQHEANQKIYLDRIENTLEKKEAWTTSFLQKSSEQSDELTMKEMYDSISGIVTSMQENLPSGVSMNVNVNEILSSILSKKPGSISASLIERASSIDTNFFLNEVKKYNFNDSGFKEQFKGLLNETNKLSQNLIILQTLESLRSLPEVFAKTIQEQNQSVEDQLNQTMAYGGFARLGGAYVRTIKTASGGDEVQTLGTYQYYNYNPPTVFPEVKDSNGKNWDLGKPELLIDRDNVPSANDLTVMVRLAKNKMGSEFKKVFNPEKRHNYEAEKGLFDPSEVEASFNDYLEGVRNGDSVSCMGKSAEQCAQSAMNSGFLVGEVADGSFGEAQFSQFYVILKTKKEMDKRKGKMDAARHRKSGGMGRFYNQLGAIAEGSVELAKGIGNTVISGVKAYMKAYSGDMKGANKDLKEAGKQSERAFQGALYAVSGAVDFALFAAETVTEPFVTVLTLGMGNETMNGTFAEGNYELAKFRDSNKAQRHVNELGMRTGAEMYANDAVLDKVVTTTLAVTGIVGAILTFTPFAPIGVGLMAISAIGTTGWKSFRGAYEGGAAGMAAGVVSGIANSALDYATEGVVGVNLSYSYANGFGAGVSIGTDNKTQLGGSIGLNYNAKSGSWGATAGLKVGLGGTDSQGNYSNWVDAGVHVNNIGRESQSQGVSANIRGQYNEKKGLNGSLGLSYDTKAGYGATIGLTSSLGPVNVTPSWTVSEYGGLSSDVQYGFDRNLFNRTNNPDHSAANRNLLSDIFDGLSGLVSGVGRGVKSAWDGMAGAVGGLNGENLSNGWNAIKNALFGGGDLFARTATNGNIYRQPDGSLTDSNGNRFVLDGNGNLIPEDENLILVGKTGKKNGKYDSNSKTRYLDRQSNIAGQLENESQGYIKQALTKFFGELSNEVTNAESIKYQKKISDMIKSGEFDKAILSPIDDSEDFDGQMSDLNEAREKVLDQYDEYYNNQNLPLGNNGIFTDALNFVYNLFGKSSGNVRELLMNTIESGMETGMSASTREQRQKGLIKLAESTAGGGFQGDIGEAMRNFDLKNRDGSWMNGGNQYDATNQQYRALSSPLSNYEKMFVLQMYVLRKQELNRLY
ncbi:hypothetical protein LEP1GSC133_3646 [Leptospira borgpetersenii serovar Pomona str. 200901868]|uniref:Uncharacterized protein n=2 Tax=Leptospira borgpetersenii serovar Pomona str. 200901868 TaxID=1192866 RepID=M6VX46_LEPBO|nr:hypothetical protein LEP1GSC133_3646 [Leptospira borgpetersenii serovar Pomona str. 200901868]